MLSLNDSNAKQGSLICQKNFLTAIIFPRRANRHITDHVSRAGGQMCLAVGYVYDQKEFHKVLTHANMRIVRKTTAKSRST